MLIVLSTSGESLNIIHALKRAQQLGLYTVAFLGKQGGAAKGLADIEILLGEELSSDRIQEGHMMALHMVVDLIENFLFQEVYVSS